MIRILHINTTLNRGGIETMLMNYYRNIDRTKIQFDFIIQCEEKCDYEDEIAKMGGKIYRLKRIKPYNPWNFERDIYQFLKKHNEYKIVHSHINAFSKYVLRAAKRAGVPNRIAHSHTILKNNNMRNIYKNIVKIGINKYATKRFACSKDAGKWLYGNADFEVLKNAIDIEKFKFNVVKRKNYRKELGIEENEIVYCDIGRFAELKNQSFLIDIFYNIQREQRAKLVLIGDGPLKEQLQQKVKKLGIENEVIFTGLRDDVNDIINAMDVFVFPSLYEGLGIVLVEAQSNGLKCFVSDTIPNEVIILDNVKVISLKCDEYKWANIILEEKNIQRSESVYKIKEAGYDVKENAKKLQKMYLEM